MYFRILKYIVEHRKIVVFVTTCALILSLIYTMISGVQYSSEALLMPPIQQGTESILSAWMASINLPAMITPASGSLTTSQILADILESRRLAEYIIESLNLKSYYGVEKTEDALKELHARTKVSVTQTGLIKLRVKDKDPEFAMKLARLYISGLDSLNRYLSFSRAVQTRDFISRQLGSYRAKLDSLRIEISEYQKKHGIVDIDEQVRGAIDLATEVRLKVVLAEIEKRLLEEFTRESSFELRRKKAEYHLLNEQLNKIMEGDTSYAVFIPLRRLPELYRNYAEMQRDLEVTEQVYSFLLQRYEETGIDVARDTPTIQVVDEPRIAEKPTGIPAPLIVLLATVVAFLWIVGMLAWIGWIQLRDKGPEEERAFEELKSILSDDISRVRRFLKI